MKTARPWIAVDIDGVLADFTFSARQWLAAHKLISNASVHGQGMQKDWLWHDVGEDLIQRLFRETDDTFFEEMAEIATPADKHALWNFYRSFGDVVYVTERPAQFIPATERWLFGNGLPASNHVLCAASGKAAFIAAYHKEARPIAIIDDKPSVLEGLANAKVQNLFVRDFPYNRGLHEEHKLRRVSSVEEFVHAAMIMATERDLP